MSTIQPQSLTKTRVFFRYWLPWLIIGLAGLAILAIWWLPDEGFARANRVVGSIMIGILGGLLVSVWFLFLSALRWWVRLSFVLAVAGAGFLLTREIRDFKFTGDMVPIVRFSWDPEPEDVLEKHRKAQAQGQVPKIKLTDEKPTDFLEYRGRNRDGIVSGPPLARDWKTYPPRQLWRQPVGGGYAGFTVTGNALVTLEQRHDQEVIVCYDTETGGEHWTYSYKALFKETLGGVGPRATPTIAGGDVFSLGATGKLVCLGLTSGSLKWSVDILKDNQNIPWGMSGSPLVFDKVVVVNPGAQTAAAAGRALVAYDRSTGDEVWQGGKHRAGYSSPMLVTLAGRRQILLFDGEGIGGYDCQTGTELWWHEWETMNGINVAQPMVLEGDRIFVSSAYGVGCNVFHIVNSGTGLKAEPIWSVPNKKMQCKFTSPVAYQGFIYGLDEGYLACLDPATGERPWKGRNYGHGQLLLSGDLLVILGERGNLALVRASPQWDGSTQNEVASMPALHGKTWNCFALVDGVAYVRNDSEMACYDLKEPAQK